MKKKIFPIALAILCIVGLSILFLPLFLLTNYYRPFQVAGDAMYPTLQNNEYYITDIKGARDGNVTRGDIVVFKAPKDPEKDYVKRIIGIPGDKIMIKEENIYLNSQLLDDKYANGTSTYPGVFAAEGEEFIVPENSYYVIGDNRPYSSDSREWGFVPKENLVGKIMFCYYNCK
jgi:signal peptidase I